jgi:8-oxo-dGTP pyrophosphatase MutT (NUDIX family)
MVENPGKIAATISGENSIEKISLILSNPSAHQLVEGYLARFPEERSRLELLLALLVGATDENFLYHRKNFVGHITASGFVLSPDGQRLALIQHVTLNRCLQPGGHVEPEDKSILDGARREVAEEIGLSSLDYLPLLAENPLIPFDIDTHGIPANPRKQEPAHFHHDFRYLFRAREIVPPPAESEIIWMPLAEAALNPAFQPALEKIRKGMGI